MNGPPLPLRAWSHLWHVCARSVAASGLDPSIWATVGGVSTAAASASDQKTELKILGVLQVLPSLPAARIGEDSRQTMLLYLAQLSARSGGGTSARSATESAAEPARSRAPLGACACTADSAATSIRPDKVRGPPHAHGWISVHGDLPLQSCRPVPRMLPVKS